MKVILYNFALEYLAPLLFGCAAGVGLALVQHLLIRAGATRMTAFAFTWACILILLAVAAVFLA